jgi:hypothetical protein
MEKVGGEISEDTKTKLVVLSLQRTLNLSVLQ